MSMETMIAIMEGINRTWGFFERPASMVKGIVNKYQENRITSKMGGHK